MLQSWLKRFFKFPTELSIEQKEYIFLIKVSIGEREGGGAKSTHKPVELGESLKMWSNNEGWGCEVEWQKKWLTHYWSRKKHIWKINASFVSIGFNVFFSSL